MQDFQGLLAFLVALSMATERITEVLKRLFLAKWLDKQETDAKKEERRKIAVQVLAIAIGTFLTSQLSTGQLAKLLHTEADPSSLWAKILVSLAFGTLAGGGSGFWNSALDIVREVNKQKQALTDDLVKRKSA